MIIATSGSARPYLEHPQLRAPHAVLVFRSETTKAYKGALTCGPTRGLTGASEGATGELQGELQGKTLATPCPDQPDPSQGLSPSSGVWAHPGPWENAASHPRSLAKTLWSGGGLSPLSPFQSLRFLAFPAFFFLAFCSTHQTFNARLGQTSLHNSDCISNSLLFTHARIENTQSDKTVSSSFVELLSAVLTRTQDTGSLKLPSVDDDNKRRT
ncbi:hypothetical protein E4U35_006357 [Claviceps purpurea]|nr:hypothetical protein E4U12_007055 [Claviceps purpurea]KAG6151277.1 hypothetical protein E4U11_007960 [Claviceps purpurea]KAG6200136.1 hypothetical protein E4U35_006357 [Claviceps purpurea]